MSDLIEKQNGRPNMEWWWDALKKVMRLYKQIHESDNPTDSPNEIDDYFLFIKQDDVEFDKKRKFTEQEKDNRLRSSRTLGFWCFNPGLGFKKIQALKPRCLILTSGTLSPMASF
jgi:regulator of telomere elongation helicase 1